MKKGYQRRLLAILCCWIILLTQVTIPALAEETYADACAHGRTMTREEAGIEAGCETAGNHTVITVCKDCGKELVRETVTDQALGHDYQETARKAATCEAEGSVTYTCSRCGNRYEAVIPALSHEYQTAETAPSCTEAGEVTFTCSLCGDSYTEPGEEALGHDYRETARTEASPDKEGSVTYTCSRCGDSYSEVIPRLEKSGQSPDSGQAETGDREQTENGSGEIKTPAPDKVENADTEEGSVITMPGSDEPVTTERAADGAAEMTWFDLQTMVSAGGEITLTNSVTAPEDASPLTVHKGKSVTLDLNGFTLDRGLSADSPAEKGSVIIVNGTLIVNDSSGQSGLITGGSTTGVGGGVWVKKNGSFTLNSGTISGNYAESSGGGVYVSGTDSNFYLCGGTIEGNTSRNGGGVAQNSTGSISISSGSITGNTATNNGGGVWFGGGSLSWFSMTGGSITDNTAAVKGGGVFINTDSEDAVDLTGGTISGNHAPEDADISVKNSSSVPRFTIVVDTTIANGTVEADKQTAFPGETVTLTATPDEYYVLGSLTVTDGNNDPVPVTDNKFIMPFGAVTVTAVFAEIRDYHIDYPDSSDIHLDRTGSYSEMHFAYPGDTVTLTADVRSSEVVSLFTVLARSDDSLDYTVEIPGISHPDPNTLTFTMPAADVKVFAEVTELNYNQNMVFICDMDGGTVEADRTIAAWDETVTLTIRPDNGYKYVPDSLEVLDVSDYEEINLGYYGAVHEIEENSRYSFEMTNHMIYVRAEFEKLPEEEKYYVLVDDETENGTLTVDPALASEGWTVTVTAVPETYRNYAVESITVTDAEGAPIDVTPKGSNKYTFTMPAGPVSVTGTFAIPVYEITAVNPDYEATGCDISVDSESEAGFSVSVFVTVMPERKMTDLTVRGDKTDTDYSGSLTLSKHNEGSPLYIYKFTMPNEPVTVTGRFAVKNYTIAADENMPGSLVLNVNSVQQTLPCTAAADDKVDLIYTAPKFCTLHALKYQCTINGTLRTISLSFTLQDDGTYAASFSMRGSDVTIFAEIEKNTAVTINGVSGSFNDKIKLNFYFDLPEDVAADEDAFVTLTNEKTEKLITLPVKDTEPVDSKGYKFSIQLAAKEASDIITARVYDGQGNTLSIRGNVRSDNDYTETGVQYSLMQYFTWLEENGKDSDEKAVGAAARDYCAAAQIYFNYNADNVSVSSAVDEVAAEALSDYIAGREGTLPTGVSIRGISALLESDNTLRLYLGFKNVEPSDFTFNIDGAETTLKQRSDGMYYLALDGGVYSNHLHNPHTYSVSYGTNPYTITASVLTYARSCAIKNNETESNLGKALYLYSQAAKEAFGY